MDATISSLCVTSYNSTGFSINTEQFVSQLLLYSQIVCLQEHFLQNSGDRKYSNTDKIRKAFKNKDMFINPAVKDNKQVTRGRAKGGLATIWDKGLTKYVSKIKCENFRLQGTKFSLPGGSLLVVNTYFPCDPRVNNFDDNEIVRLLSDINNLIRDSDSSNILVAGDLNSHFSRNTRFSNLIKDFFEEQLDFKIFFETPSDKIHPVDYTHLFISENITSCSTIDHFIGNQNVFGSVTEAGVTHYAENFSNHSPIYVKLDVGQLSLSMEKAINQKRTRWNKASEEARDHFKNDLAVKLNALPVPVSVTFQNIHCKIHSEDYTMNVLQYIESSAQASLPSVGGAKQGHGGQPGQVAGWTEHVKPFHDESKFWHGLWTSSGKPLAGPLFNIMKQAKMQFKYAFRRLKRASNKLQNDRFVDSILQGGVNIFQEIKKFRGKSSNCSSRIDEEVGSTNIANHFAGIYSNLYNQVEQAQKITDLQVELNSKISSADISEIDRIDENMIKMALGRMKGNKSDSIFDFQSDCLINGPPELLQHLVHMGKFLTSFLVVLFFLWLRITWEILPNLTTIELLLLVARF